MRRILAVMLALLQLEMEGFVWIMFVLNMKDRERKLFKLFRRKNNMIFKMKMLLMMKKIISVINKMNQLRLKQFVLNGLISHFQD